METQDRRDRARVRDRARRRRGRHLGRSRRCLTVAIALTAVGTAGYGPAPASAAKKLTRSRAQTALEKYVDRVYRSRVDGRPVIATCRRVSRRLFDCQYDVLRNGEDGFNDGLNGEDPDSPYKYSGYGTVRQAPSGALIVRASRPS